MHLGPHQMPHHRSIMRPHTSKIAGLCKQIKILSQVARRPMLLRDPWQMENIEKSCDHNKSVHSSHIKS
ncbi:hypothetical protein OESDEN_20664 [Oesophagostomum dentatum]|uniref:Uncharacterized protein n=1 Tax=Oesophagostomum dentatum TaxID=61180 RepID=A0A0B1S859_OESDE|nr:hypothetical protein OESDEN_20664 [Oesophagostomum dentatum]